MGDKSCKTVRRRQVQFLPVASRTLPAPAGRQPQTAPQLLYKLTFQPPASRGARPRLEIAFVVSGTAAVAPTAVPAAPAGFQPERQIQPAFPDFPVPLRISWQPIGRRIHRSIKPSSTLSKTRHPPVSTRLSRPGRSTTGAGLDTDRSFVLRGSTRAVPSTV